MSFIDSYDHEFIGTLGYYPIYHPLEEIIAFADCDFNASSRNLVLGDGSGGLSALVVHKLECLAAHFLYDQLIDDEIEQLSDTDREYLDDLVCEPFDAIFEFFDWSIRDYSSLPQMAMSRAFMAPFNEDGDEEVESWLCRSLGELIYFSLPDLNPEHERLESIFKNFEIHATMENVRCSPPGYPTPGGRKLVDGKHVFGICRWNLTP